MKKYCLLTIISTIIAILLIKPVSANAMTSYEINQKMSTVSYFDVDRERELANAEPLSNIQGYTPTEIAMICSIVMRETGYGDVLSKQLVTNVIRNRLLSSRFPDTVEGVLNAKDQFPTVENWYTNEWPVIPSTRLSVCYTLMSQYDVSNGALYFYATYLDNYELVNWFENNLTFCCEYYGQRYFK
mgnify:CR=1 FL=1